MTSVSLTILRFLHKADRSRTDEFIQAVKRKRHITLYPGVSHLKVKELGHDYHSGSLDKLQGFGLEALWKGTGRGCCGGS